MTSVDPGAMRRGVGSGAEPGRARGARRAADRNPAPERRWTRDPADPAFRPEVERLRGTSWLDRLVDDGDDD